MIWSIYVSQSAQKNFNIGLSQNIWGAKKDVFSKANVGDYVIFVFALSWSGDGDRPAGFPRLKLNDIDKFRGKTKLIIKTKISKLFFEEIKLIWEDDIYPHRFSFEILGKQAENQPFGLDYYHEDFVHSVRKSLLSKGAISEVNNDPLEDIFIHTTSIKEGYKFNLQPPINMIDKNNISPVLGVEEISEALASIIINQPEDSGMMVGIFGKWGRGKTFLAERTWQSIKARRTNFQRVIFSAWKYQDTKASWAYLYKSLLDQYLFEEETTNWIYKGVNKVKKYYKLLKLNTKKYSVIPVISLLASGLWLFAVDDKVGLYKEVISIFGVVTLIQIIYFYFKHSDNILDLFSNYFSKRDFSDYLGFQAEVENEITNLLKTWIKTAGPDKKIVLFVDDIDRCNINQVLTIIDGLRVILDNSEINNRLIIITAVDETILELSLKQKYESFYDQHNIFKEYLEKIFIIGLKLNSLSDVEIQDFLTNIIPRPAEESNPIQIEKSSPNRNGKTELSSTSASTITNDTDIQVDHDLDIHVDESKYLLKQVINLENATPRKIRIFYYKYLVMKKLLMIKLEANNLLDEWEEINEEHIIIDALIHSTNGGCIDVYFLNNVNKAIRPELIETVKYVVLMVSVL